MNKDEERKILSKVYPPSSFFEIVSEDEEPDFILKNPKSEYSFGVEVTELFRNESNARLKKIPNYSENLINKKEFRHKDDKSNFRIDSIQIFDQGGKLKLETMALIQELPPINEYIEVLTERISNKENKTSTYLQKNIKHVNLIIYDQENYFNAISINTFFSTLFIQNLIDVIKNSKYREIYLITRIEEKDYYAYLKSLFLSGEFWLFHEYFMTHHPYDFKNYKNFLKLFLKYCSSLNLEKIYYSEKDGSTIVYYGDLFILFIEDKVRMGRAFEVDYSQSKHYTSMINDYIPPKGLLMDYNEFRKDKQIQTNWLEEIS